MTPPEEEIAQIVQVLGTRLLRDESLANHTTYHVGGTAALYVELTSTESLELLAEALVDTTIPLLVVGNGSNLLVADSGFPGLVIHLSGIFGELRLSLHEGRLDVGGAVALPVIARRAVAGGFAGLEWMVGIPGYMGGAIAMNAGGHGASTEQNLHTARVLELRTGIQREYRVDELECAYRSTRITDDELVISAMLEANEARDRAHSRALLDEIVSWRRANQPGGRNCGSVFTNPVGDSAGRLIEAAGLKGYRVGGAEVSPKHANFIQSESGGTAADVAALIEIVRHRVFESSGVVLETELRMVGFPDA